MPKPLFSTLLINHESTFHLFFWLVSIVPGGLTYSQQPLTSKQIEENDRFEWTTITTLTPLPLPRLIKKIKNAIEGRSSLILHPAQKWVKYKPKQFTKYPFLHWEMCGTPPDLSFQDKLHFRDFFNMGGTLFLDYCDNTNPEIWKAWGASIFSETKWSGLTDSHILSFSFYLLEKHAMLNRGRSSISILENDDRYIIIMNQNPFFSWNYFQQSNVSKFENSFNDEKRLRFYINLMMYLLTGSYKKDQQHLPTILLRRK